MSVLLRWFVQKFKYELLYKYFTSLKSCTALYDPVHLRPWRIKKHGTIFSLYSKTY